MITLITTATPIQIINDNYKDLPSHGHVPKKDRRVGRRLESYPHLNFDLESIDPKETLIATYNLVNKDGTETTYRRFTRHVPSNGPCYWKEDNIPFVTLEYVDHKTVSYSLFHRSGTTVPTKATLTF